MKNFVIITILLIIGFVAYNYINQTGTDELDTKAKMSTKSATILTTAPNNASVSIIAPLDGAIVKSPVTVKFGISNMQIAPAGSDLENSGHHHLLIDMEKLPDLTMPLPATPSLIHFGGGQTKATIELTPGVHTLQLILGDALHTPHKTPVISEKIKIHVRSPSPLSQ